MTSGLNDVALARPKPPAKLAAMVKLIAGERLQFKPGSRFLYSNDGYILLGAIIEHLSGQSYDRYVREHAFKPAGMSHTDVSVYVPAAVPSMAHGYTLVPNGGPASPTPAQESRPMPLRDNSTMPQIANPSGGAYPTVEDLARFAQALLDDRLLTPAMTATVLKPRVDAPQPGGPPVDAYTYGFAYQQINHVTFVGHNGGTPGYEGQIDIYPHTDDVVVILANQDQTMVPAIQKSEAILTHSS
ncbi:MAG: serine hydrolase domain-containing protein [Solirubrobacteraceae bacterium]|jgi:CubicO group peptidase (beta-lactamase class C family)